MYPHQGDAHFFHPEFTQGHKINIGEPNPIHESLAPLSEKIKTPVKAEKLEELKKLIGVYRSLQYSSMKAKEFPEHNTPHLAFPQYLTSQIREFTAYFTGFRVAL